MTPNTVPLVFESFGDHANPPLIILHGFFASSRNWRQIAQQLAQQHYVYVVDQRNHGRSPHDPVMDYPSMARDLAGFMDDQGLEKSALLGHSMGGKVAMWFALNQPERVNKMIIVDIAPVSYQHSFNDLINALKNLPLPELNNRKEADSWLQAAIPEASFRQFLLQNLVLEQSRFSWRINLDIFYHSAPHIIDFPDTNGMNYQQDNVLFIVGGNSNYTDPNAVYDLFPNAGIKAIENAGHWLHAEKPGEFVEVANSFLLKD
ncbi:alpha/beta fold hydrolase [Methylicorpusculum sp.]|uniref:alpha/beta fold hydrolase n=2 Tax=Methylicorpusculum sp. TaxID=2713644 RepID=UPI0027317232|nr:alpha/beta fold hydrolase [Methylicorpusculum sp.]MDP2179542.1 alpha/beta fold hydrolase [Methylicorpusculum sp.]MDP3527665.1 alpha/beta fold hydrolase [Methylicorpusculum sp.]